MGDSALSQEDIDNLLGGGFDDSDINSQTTLSNDTSDSQDSIFDGLDSLIGGGTPETKPSNPAVSKGSDPGKASSSKKILSNMESQGNLSLLLNVVININVELGKKSQMIKEILALGEGSIIELDKAAGDPVDILANNRHLAKGEVVVVDEQFGVRVTEMVDPLKIE